MKNIDPWTIGEITNYEKLMTQFGMDSFDKFKTNPYVVIMGGMDEADGIKGLAKELLDDGEFKDASKKGNGEMFLKFKKWDPMQTVIMFAGSDMAAAAEARQENRETWWNSFITWFDLEADMEGFHVY